MTTAEINTYIKNFSLNKQYGLFADGPNAVIEYINIGNIEVPKYINEFWTSKQRQASSIHEISYRACFKPQLPQFFIQLLSSDNDVVYDPFSGRGTTPIEAALLGRQVISNDINPLSEILTRPRLMIPDFKDVERRLNTINYKKQARADIDLSMFYHPKTESEIVSLREYLIEKDNYGVSDEIDNWIRMVATNRLTGHSKGFFSVYTLPPNQAVSPDKQIMINIKLNQTPDYRDTKKLILNKTKSLLRNLTAKQKDSLRRIGGTALFFTEDARNTPEIKDETVQLVVTSPPFLDTVQYSKDNWLRCWFNNIDIQNVSERITMSNKVEEWTYVMNGVFAELYRVLKKDGWIAFEVGEVRRGKLKLDEYIVPLGLNNGFSCAGILINTQDFTKTSNIWGIKNMEIGTNTNRIVIFKKN